MHHVTLHTSPTPRPMKALTRIAALAALLVVALPGLAAAQEKVYAPEELSAAPKLAAPAEVARIVRDAYPPALKRAGVGGSVELEFVVDSEGKVDPASVQIIQAAPAALGPAAKSAVEKFRFKPGQVNGQPVRTRVAIPLVFRA